MQFLTYFRVAGHLIFLPFASALQATVACLTRLLKFGWREFDGLGDAIAHEFAARGPRPPPCTQRSSLLGQPPQRWASSQPQQRE
jgi:hypothetical protein